MPQLLLDYHLKKSGLFTHDQLTDLKLEPLAGGTNDVFLLRAPDQQQYVVKIPKPATQRFIDRRNEHHAMQLTAAAGINIPCRYFDIHSGVNITPYQTGSQILTEQLLCEPIIWRQAVDLLKKTHQLPEHFQKNVNIFAAISFYQTLLPTNLPDDLTDICAWNGVINQWRDEFAHFDIPAVSCHGDPMLNNFLLTPQQMYLIDWEYASNNDPCWDLATLSVEAQFNTEQQQQLLDYYYQHQVTPQIQRRFAIYQLLSNYLWALWCIVMLDPEQPDDTLLKYAQQRLQRFKTTL